MSNKNTQMFPHTTGHQGARDNPLNTPLTIVQLKYSQILLARSLQFLQQVKQLHKYNTLQLRKY